LFTEEIDNGAVIWNYQTCPSPLPPRAHWSLFGPVSTNAYITVREDWCDVIDSALAETFNQGTYVTIQFNKARLDGFSTIPGVDPPVCVSDFPRDPNLTQWVANHELGHALGLHENFSSPLTLMWQGARESWYI
jgi:hypothetical protein